MLISEFKNPDAIALVWPEGLPAGTAKLKSFYVSLIRELSKNIKVLVILNDQDLQQKVEKLFPEREKVEFKIIPEISDIWIRDFGPVFKIADNKPEPLFFSYQPSYFHSKFQKDILEKNKEAGRQLAIKLGYDNSDIIKVDGEELKLDGGNFIFNGSGTAIVTNRMIKDNETLLIEDIQNSLLQKAGISRLRIIPSEPQDDTGHADGTVRFVNEDLVLVLKYQESAEPESIRWAETVARHLDSSGLRVKRITNGDPKDGVYTYRNAGGAEGSFENAWGNYLNYLRIGNIIYLPVYEKLESLNDGALKLVTEVSGCEVIPVNIPDALAEYGGLLNCITLPVFYKK